MSIKSELKDRIMILDGAMGTMIQAQGLPEEAWRGERFAHWPVSLKGNNDVLNITRPDVIKAIHQAYIDAGADIITTNTFSSQRISQGEYQCEELSAELNRAGASIAREVADRQSRKVYVAGSMGPTSKSLTLAPDMNHPELRSVSFEEMASAYEEQARALLQGGVDVLLLETCYDALNAKAALYAISKVGEERGEMPDVMVSATINDRSGRTLTGQTLDAFFTSVSHYPILSFGLNCSFGVKELRPFVEQLAEHCPVYISIYPNAGLPNEMGGYDEQPEFTARYIKEMASERIINIAGGCCGTTPEHVRAIALAVKDLPPRQVPLPENHLVVSGLENVVVDKATQNFINVGERTNVAGSRKFARLIGEKKYDEALSVARKQIENGAQIIDINMDDAMLDSRKEMGTFLRYIAGEPAVARSALMIDSSDWPTVIEGLRNAQGKCIVNSISLKNGETEFLAHAHECQLMGAAVVVMAFDENGQATTYERKTAICQRAYHLLVDRLHFSPHDIIFDVNVLSVGTGIEEHANYGIDFIKAVGWIKNNLPGALTSGGISNLSFAFRGNNVVREAMHSVFLYHAIAQGLDMGIVNPGMLQVYDDIEPHLLRAVENVILNKTPGATEQLIDLAQQVKAQTAGEKQTVQADNWRREPVEERLAHALAKGIGDYLGEDIPEALAQTDGDPVKVIEGPLMSGMEKVGKMFGEGKMFLPQVVKSAKIMKLAVDILQPEIEKHNKQGSLAEKPKVVMATVKGDVHDIGKNIVAIVLRCNNFDVIDLGVMVPAETILATVKREKPLLVGVSGLITPSLKEMENLCKLFEREHMHVPIIVGGATTTAVHTAVKLAPLYQGGVLYGRDASQTSLLAKKVQIDRHYIEENREEQELIRQSYEASKVVLTPFDEANRKAPRYDHSASLPTVDELNERARELRLSLTDLKPLIDWRMLLFFWGFRGETIQQMTVNPEAAKTLREAQDAYDEAIRSGSIKVTFALDFLPAHARGNDILTDNGITLPMLRSQSERGGYRCLSDYLPSKGSSPLGLFVLSAWGLDHYEAQSYEQLMQHALCARVAEAAAVYMQQCVLGTTQAIRPAFGYATCPDQTLKKTVFEAVNATERMGARLTEGYAIMPDTSICGMLILHPEAQYFSVGRIGADQLADYCRRTGLDEDTARAFLAKNI